MAVHEAMDRRWVDEQWNDAEPATCFTARPEIGLWGVATALDTDCGPAAAQAIADVLQNIRPAGTLSALVEQVRTTLEAVQRHFAARSSVAAGANIAASAAVFVTVGAECAVLRSGPAQAVRFRSSLITPICGGGPADMPLPDAVVARMPMRDSGAVNGTLLDLVTGSAVPRVSMQEIVQVQVCYESVHAEDRWLISAAPVFEERALTELAAVFKFEGEESLALVRDICAAEDASSRQLPVLLLTARATENSSDAASVGRGGQG